MSSRRVIIALIVVLLLASLACDETRSIFNRIDGTPTAALDTCVPDCAELCSQIQEKHGNPPEVCVSDCAAVCEKAEAGE